MLLKLSGLQKLAPISCLSNSSSAIPPKPMRRHISISGGLAEITFGGGENPEGMSLHMLVSEVAALAMLCSSALNRSRIGMICLSKLM